MSTKIYDAYRTTSKFDGNLFELVRKLRVQATLAAIDKIDDLIEQLKPTVKFNQEEYEKFITGKFDVYKNEQFYRAHLASELIDKGYKDQVSSHLRNPFHLDVTLGIREFQGKYYITTYADWNMKGVWNFLNSLPELEAYEYWNNTDRPDGISKDEWEQREKDWDNLDKDWRNVLELHVIDHNNWYLFSPVMALKPDGKLNKGYAAWLNKVGQKPKDMRPYN